ncbi:MAG: glycerol-3-phosphate cytidyltransferase TagD [Microgenomates group bacterium LiPW_16]|nr:MAG: glycerol-3-phosphate cytidyltransferase TagD [Microgenomates group bacterium LiPW_16]
MKKIITLEQSQDIIKRFKNEAKTIVLAGGCFDILHLGHLKFLEAGKSQGDILIVALESDENVKRLKGQGRPINQQILRAENLNRTGLVDYVLLLPDMRSDTDYLRLVKALSPDVIAVTAGDPQFKNKQKGAKIVGAQVKIVIHHLSGFSTSQILNNL